MGGSPPDREENAIARGSPAVPDLTTATHRGARTATPGRMSSANAVRKDGTCDDDDQYRAERASRPPSGRSLRGGAYPPPRPGRLCRVRFYDGAFGEEADYARGLRFVRGRLGDIRDGGGGSSRMVRPVRGKHTRCKEEGARAEAALGLYT